MFLVNKNSLYSVSVPAHTKMWNILLLQRRDRIIERTSEESLCRIPRHFVADACAALARIFQAHNAVGSDE